MENIKNFKYDKTEIIEMQRVENGVFTDDGGYTYDNLPCAYRVRLKTCLNSKSIIINEIWLPDNWNGIFLGVGNGGMAGDIAYWMMMDYVKEGYVVANSDLGTSGGRERGINNPEVWKDFGWRATHIMTDIAKSLLKEHYGEKEKFSYFYGLSTGGEQSLSEAQRFPDDYDGIIAGVPANNRIFLHTYFLWNYVHLYSKDGEGKFSDEEINTITACATKYFQVHGDGEKGDNFISYPYINESTVDDFISYIRNENPYFTDTQLEALKAVYKGPSNPKTGEQIYNGMPIGSEIYGCGISECQGEESPFYYPFIWAFGKDYNPFNFDFDEDMDKISDLLSGDMNANNANLSEFYKNGGKLIAFSGSADPCVPYPDAMKYYNRVVKKMGGYDKTSEFFRFFLCPGKDHGLTGRGTNAHWGSMENKEGLLDVLRRWRETGEAPEYIVSARVEGERTVFARKTYPYKGDMKEGKEFPVSCSEKYFE